MEAQDANPLFDMAFDAALTQFRREAQPPAGLEQRLAAHFANEHRPAYTPFAYAGGIKAQRSPKSFWTAIGVHGAAIALIAFMVAKHVQLSAPTKEVLRSISLLASPPPVAPKTASLGGGGGQHDVGPATLGRLPKFAKEQLLPPKAPPMDQPRLAAEPTVNVQPDLKMANNDMPTIGMPNSTLRGVSMGNGSGTGLGSGEGSGVGPGSGGNTGGGVMHVGGAVRPPIAISTPDPEFSEEARKAKFSGNVEVYLWVDEQGNPSHIRVARGVGMGLDQKAIEAVRQYKFKPALKDGKPVKVDLYVDVGFQIY